MGPTEEDVIRELVGLSDDAMRARLSDLVGEQLSANWDAEYTERYREVLARDLEAIDGVAQAIDVIEQAGLATCVASSGSHELRPAWSRSASREAWSPPIALPSTASRSSSP